MKVSFSTATHEQTQMFRQKGFQVPVPVSGSGSSFWLSMSVLRPAIQISKT